MREENMDIQCQRETPANPSEKCRIGSASYDPRFQRGLADYEAPDNMVLVDGRVVFVHRTSLVC